MKKIVGINFKSPGKIYYFDPGDFKLEKGMHVIVDTAMGEEYGEVTIANKEVEDSAVSEPLKKVLRIATPKEDKLRDEFKAKEASAFEECAKQIQEYDLPMKLIEAEYKYDGSKLTFYFSSEKRIDFRELVKSLASIFKTRIEMRQIGVRDEVKRLGGNGICGRELCCCSFLRNFETVSIKMAKEQNLSLNPTKISGVCGRLMCCLTNEEETYEELNSRLPAIGDFVTTSEGLKGEVQSVSVLRQLVKVVVSLENDEKEIREYKVSELRFRPRKKKNDVRLSKEEMKELAALEKN